MNGELQDQGIEVLGRAQKAFVVNLGDEGAPVAEICRKDWISQTYLI